MADSVSTVLGFARTFSNTDSNGLTDADGLTLANEALLDFRAWLIEHGASAGNIQEAFASATTDVGQYAWPSDLWMLKELEVNYQDTSKNNYVPVTQIDVGNLPAGTSLEWVRNNQPKTKPTYATYGSWYEIFPAPSTTVANDNLTNFFRIFYFQAPGTYSGTSSTIGYPESLDDLTLAYRVAAIHNLRKGSGNLYQGLNNEYLKRANRILNIVRQGSQTPFKPQGLPLTGWEY